jgi:dTDP-L-rhamnose 4-epimerase
MAEAVGAPEIQPVVTGKYRAGDIRHCFADVTEARALLGFEAEVTLDRGLAELAAWLGAQPAPSADRADEARAELDAWGLTL